MRRTFNCPKCGHNAHETEGGQCFCLNLETCGWRQGVDNQCDAATKRTEQCQNSWTRYRAYSRRSDKPALCSYHADRREETPIHPDSFFSNLNKEAVA